MYNVPGAFELIEGDEHEEKESFYKINPDWRDLIEWKLT